jgi:putative hydrolase of the HAD superfamily
MIRAVVFDVDFTLIHPGPVFQGAGYEQFCASHGITIDPSGFERAVAGASRLLDDADEALYDPQVFVDYTRHIIETMGGRGPAVEACARHIYEEWACCGHFTLYAEVPAVLCELHARGVKIGLISNTHRCLTSFQSHFALDGLIAAAVSSSVHGRMKPHPSIFHAALGLLRAGPGESLMVGDSLLQDVEGARRAGMRAALVCRSGRSIQPPPGVPVLNSLMDVPPLLVRMEAG